MTSKIIKTNSKPAPDQFTSHQTPIIYPSLTSVDLPSDIIQIREDEAIYRFCEEKAKQRRRS
jgi:hypothetical protein